MRHYDGKQRHRQAPHALVEHDGQGVFHEVSRDELARLCHQPRIYGEPFAPEHTAQDNNDLERAAYQRCYGGAGAAHGGCAQLAEDQHVVEKNVQGSGHRQQDRAELRILHASLYGDIDAGKGHADVGEADYPGILRAGFPEVRVVGNDAHHLHGEQAGQQGNYGRQPDGDVIAHAHDAVYGVQPALAVVLGDQYARPALYPEDDQREHEEYGVRHGHGCKFRFAQDAHHEGVGKGHEVCDQVL